MIAEEIRNQVLTAEGVKEFRICLKDHFASETIEAAVNAGKFFTDAFPGDSFGNLDELRDIFLRKGFFKREEEFLRSLTQAGLSPEEICALRIGDVSIEGDSCHVSRRGGGLVHIVPARVGLRY